jgi:hypothetical protein
MFVTALALMSVEYFDQQLKQALRVFVICGFVRVQC